MGSLTAAVPTRAQQVEDPIPCTDGVLRYGAHATACALATPSETDVFKFQASGGTRVRINVGGGTHDLDPLLELFDPDGAVVPLTPDRCAAAQFGLCTLITEPSLPSKVGEYTLLVSDDGFDNAGAYDISLHCIVGPCDSDGVPPPDPAPSLLSYDQPVEDTISPAVDMDFWAFYAQAGHSLRLNLRASSNDFDPKVEVFDPSGQAVALAPFTCASAQFGLCTFETEFSPAQTGAYTIFLSDDDVFNAGDYQLSLNCILGACDSDGVPPADPGPLALAYDAPLQDGIAPAVDMDPFVFAAQIGTLVRLNVRADSNDVDPEVEVFAPSGLEVTLAPASCASPQFGICTFSAEFAPGESGDFRLFVSDDDVLNAGGYQVSLNCIAGSCDSDGEPPPDPSPPAFGYDAAEQGVVVPAVDMDPYVFQGSSGSLVRLAVLSASNDFDPRVEIVDPNGNGLPLSIPSCQAAQFGVCSFEAEFTPPTTGRYSLFVSDDDTLNAGNYQVAMACLIGPCDSDLDGFLDPDPPAISGYGTPQPTAQSPESGVGVSPAVDSDPFTLKGQSGTRIRLTVTGLSNDFDPRIELRDPSGAVVPLPNEVCSAAQFGTCSFSSDVTLSSSGTFTLSIRDDQVDNPGTYTFSVTCLIGSCPPTPRVAPPVCTGGGTTGCRDNCRLIPDMSQADVGGVGAAAPADGIGDTCQCGDVNGNGRVTTADATLITRSLLVPPTATLARPDKCNVNAGNACSTADAVITTRALLVPPTASILQACSAAFR